MNYSDENDDPIASSQQANYRPRGRLPPFALRETLWTNLLLSLSLAAFRIRCHLRDFCFSCKVVHQPRKEEVLHVTVTSEYEERTITH
jgi:hypothetical protein